MLLVPSGGTPGRKMRTSQLWPVTGSSSSTTLSWIALVGVMLGMLALYVALTAIYNIWFHPLRKFPGPWWLVASRWPYTISILRGTATRRAKELHEKHGHVVRINPDTLSYTSGEAWRDIYGSKQYKSQPGIPKDPLFYIRHQGPANISTVHDEDHHRLRRVQFNAFSPKALASHEVHVRHHASELVSQLKSRATNFRGETTMDLIASLETVVTDIISKLIFGESFGLLQQEEPRIGQYGVFWVLKNYTFTREMLRWPDTIKRAVLALMAEKPMTKKHAMSMAHNAANKRLAASIDGFDFVSCMRKGSSKFSMSEGEIRTATTAFIIAGSETTATALAATIFILCRHPTVYTELIRSIRSDFSLESDMTLSKLQQHELLNGVLQESLRLYPPAPDNLFRRTEKHGSAVMGQVLPPNTSVTMNVWAANTSPLNFHRPNEMLPERWAKSCPEAFAADDREAFNPFGVGPKDCLGKSLAWMEMRIILAYLVWHFEFELTQESEKWMDNQRVFMFWEKPALKVVVKNR